MFQRFVATLFTSFKIKRKLQTVSNDESDQDEENNTDKLNESEKSSDSNDDPYQNKIDSWV